MNDNKSSFWCFPKQIEVQRLFFPLLLLQLKSPGPPSPALLFFHKFNSFTGAVKVSEREARESERAALCMLGHVSRLNASGDGLRWWGGVGGRLGRRRAQRITGPAGRDGEEESTT